MREIALLDQLTIDKIAAGEVVERPSSVVKELTENAIDADATAITVEIKDGGCALIRVTDNGAGIRADDLPLAFCRHATSKIRSAEDLEQIASLGFRGEALASIAAVARIECVSKTKESLTGCRYVTEGGREITNEEVGAPNGTTILVRDLFYNTPARAKFLRSAVTEANKVSAVVEELALSHPEISFKYIQNGQERLYTSGNGNVRELIRQIFGRDVSEHLLELNAASELCSIHGFLGKPEISRGNRNFENYFVNGRYIRSELLAKAIEDGYHGRLMQHRYPFCLLYLELDGRAVDVNVHPTKMEVRFSSQKEIYAFLLQAVRDCLASQSNIPDVERTVPTESKLSDAAKTAPAESRIPDAAKAAPSESSIPDAAKTASFKNRISEPAPEPFEVKRLENIKESDQAAPAPEQASLFAPEFFGEEAKENRRLIGQIFDTYWLFEYEDSLFIIDQHAAHEKVLYERLLAASKEKTISCQQLYPAPVLSLGRAEEERIRRYQDALSELGFSLEDFGGGSWKVTEVPADLYSVSADDFLRDLIDQLDEIGEGGREVILSRLAQMACKAAVKGTERISAREMEHLLEEMLKLENPYHCPHGRPTAIRMSRKEIEKEFRRIL